MKKKNIHDKKIKRNRKKLKIKRKKQKFNTYMKAWVQDDMHMRTLVMRGRK